MKRNLLIDIAKIWRRGWDSKPATHKAVTRKKRETVTAKKQPTATAETPAPVEFTGFDQRVEAVAQAIKQLLPNFDGKQMLVAEHINIRPADISMALNHATRKANSKETVTEKALQRMETALAEVLQEVAA